MNTQIVKASLQAFATVYQQYEDKAIELSVIKERLEHEFNLLSKSDQRFLQSGKIKDISEALGVPSRTVKRRLSDVRKKYKQELHNQINDSLDYETPRNVLVDRFRGKVSPSSIDRIISKRTLSKGPSGLNDNIESPPATPPATPEVNTSLNPVEVFNQMLAQFSEQYGNQFAVSMCDRWSGQHYVIEGHEPIESEESY